MKLIVGIAPQNDIQKDEYLIISDSIPSLFLDQFPAVREGDDIISKLQDTLGNNFRMGPMPTEGTSYIAKKIEEPTTVEFEPVLSPTIMLYQIIKVKPTENQSGEQGGEEQMGKTAGNT